MRIVLTTESAPERERFAIWRESVFRSFAPVTIERRPDQHFASHMDARLFDGLTTIDIAGSGYAMKRTRSDIAAGTAEFYLAFQILEGPIEVEVPAGTVTFQPGDIGLGAPDTAWGMTPHPQRYRTRNVMVPRQLVDPWLAAGTSLTAAHLPATRGFSALLGDFMSSLVDNAEALAPVELATASQTFGRLMAVAAGFDGEAAEVGHAAVNAARLERAKGLIERQFMQMDLTPARAAHALGISLRQLHLLFEPTGQTFSERLLQRRLQECFARLSDPNMVGRSITEIAFDAGFENLQSFYRSFRRVFAMTPGDLRAQAMKRG